MKALMVIAVVLAIGYLVLDYQAEKFLDDNLQKFDIGELIVEACGSNEKCLNATNEYYPSCKPESGEMDAEEYFAALDATVNCIHEKSGVDIDSLVEGQVN